MLFKELEILRTNLNILIIMISGDDKKKPVSDDAFLAYFFEEVFRKLNSVFDITSPAPRHDFPGPF